MKIERMIQSSEKVKKDIVWVSIVVTNNKMFIKCDTWILLFFLFIFSFYFIWTICKQFLAMSVNKSCYAVNSCGVAGVKDHMSRI